MDNIRNIQEIVEDTAPKFVGAVAEKLLTVRLGYFLYYHYRIMNGPCADLPMKTLAKITVLPGGPSPMATVTTYQAFRSHVICFDGRPHGHPTEPFWHTDQHFPATKPGKYTVRLESTAQHETGNPHIVGYPLIVLKLDGLPWIGSDTNPEAYTDQAPNNGKPETIVRQYEFFVSP